MADSDIIGIIIAVAVAVAVVIAAAYVYSKSKKGSDTNEHVYNENMFDTSPLDVDMTKEALERMTYNHPVR